jgi:hypothetical protein
MTSLVHRQYRRMEEASIGGDQPFIAHDQAAELSQPGESPFDDPPATIAAQFAPILMGGAFMVAARRDNRVNAAPGQSCAQGIAGIAPTGLHRGCTTTRSPDVNRPLRNGENRTVRAVEAGLPWQGSCREISPSEERTAELSPHAHDQPTPRVL